jgi:hypothetical protein
MTSKKEYRCSDAPFFVFAISAERIKMSCLYQSKRLVFSFSKNEIWRQLHGKIRPEGVQEMRWKINQ